MDNPLPLGPSEIVPDRPFTHPERSAEDLARLRHIAQRLRLVLSQPRTWPNDPSPLILNLQEADGRAHRIVIARRAELLTVRTLTVVGFFGQKRPEADVAPLSAVDDELIREFPQHPYVLSYCSLLLEDGNWGNSVLLNAPEAREHWRTSPRHQYAARELAPSYYATLRLHNAVLSGGLLAGNDWKLLRTKYYDFQGATPWHAIREFAAD